MHLVVGMDKAIGDVQSIICVIVVGNSGRGFLMTFGCKDILATGIMLLVLCCEWPFSNLSKSSSFVAITDDTSIHRQKSALSKRSACFRGRKQ